MAKDGTEAVEMIKDYTNKCINSALNKGIIITGESGVGCNSLAMVAAGEKFYEV